MNERQLELILQITREQLTDYLDEELAEKILAGIVEGLNDNRYMLDELAEG